MQKVYIDQLLNAYQMSNCNLSSIPIGEGTNLVPIFDDYLPNTKDISTYKEFIGSV